VIDAQSEVVSLEQQTQLGEHHLVRRSRMETVYEVLQVIESGPMIITHIMYRTNLSWKAVNELLKTFERQGLVASSSQQGKNAYNLTQKGRALLHQFSQIRDELRLER